MQLYDGVTLPAEGSLPSMTGVIVYKKDETIGIRLTGDSEGMGDHCGSVDGVEYFDGGVNSGVMTSIHKVEPRKLTVSEEALIRSLLQPKPAYSTPMASSMPMSGLSPAALARMMQLNQRMGVSPATSSTQTTTPRNKLPPSTPTAAADSPPTPILSDPPTVLQKNSSEDREPALEEEKPPERKLSRLEILRQKKEAIRKRKLELSKKVEETKKEKLQQQQQEEAEEPTVKPQQEEAAKPQEPPSMEAEDKKSTSPTSINSQNSSSSSKRMPPPASVVRSQDISMQDEVASVKSKESSMFSKASRSSRDSIEQLWIDELRNETPASAARYDLEDAENLLLEEDEGEDPPESVRSLHMEGIVRVQKHEQDELSESNDKLNDQSSDRHPEPMRQSSMSRLQQLRQKKRLLEALPASIQTPVAPPNLVNLALAAALGHCDNLAGFPEQSRAMAQDCTDDEDEEEEDEDDNKTTASALSDMEDDNNQKRPRNEIHDDAVPAAFQESVTITADSTNPLPAGEGASNNYLKRRRMLGLGFLPGINREQKRQNTGRGHNMQ